MVSTGKGRTTCGYFLPDNKHIVYGSTHEAGDACPPAADRSDAGEVAATGGEEEEQWPDVNLATSFSGLLGATLSMLLAGLLGFILLRLRQHH